MSFLSFWEIIRQVSSQKHMLYCTRKAIIFWGIILLSQNYCCCSVAKSCPTLCDPMDGNIPGFPVHHLLPEFAQVHAHSIGDAIKPSHPLSELPVFKFLYQHCYPVYHTLCFSWVIFEWLISYVLHMHLNFSTFHIRLCLWLYLISILKSRLSLIIFISYISPGAIQNIIWYHISYISPGAVQNICNTCLMLFSLFS